MEKQVSMLRLQGGDAQKILFHVIHFQTVGVFLLTPLAWLRAVELELASHIVIANLDLARVGKFF